MGLCDTDMAIKERWHRLFSSRMNDTFSDTLDIKSVINNLLERLWNLVKKLTHFPLKFILLINSLHFRSKPHWGHLSVIVEQITPDPHLFRNSMYSVCLMRPVLIMIVWKHCRSMAHSFTFVRAGKKETHKPCQLISSRNLNNITSQLRKKHALQQLYTLCMHNMNIVNIICTLKYLILNLKCEKNNRGVMACVFCEYIWI